MLGVGLLQCTVGKKSIRSSYLVLLVDSILMIDDLAVLFPVSYLRVRI